jgi:hypothetical protein
VEQDNVIPLFKKPPSKEGKAKPPNRPFYDWFVEPRSLAANKMLKERLSQYARTELYDSHGRLRKVWPILFEFARKLDALSKEDHRLEFRMFSRPVNAPHRAITSVILSDEATADKEVH